MSTEITTEVKADVSEEVSEKEEKKGKGKGKVIAVLVLTLLLAAGVGTVFHFYTRTVNYVTTDNARVTTNIIRIMSPMGGTLERLTVAPGHRVAEDEIIGWVDHNGPLRSPVNGVVVESSAVLNQVVAPMEPVAVIADTDRIHIQANISENDIMRVQRGQTVIVTIDALGNRQFTGYISEIGRITSAELTGNVLFFNTGGTFTRVTHLIPVEIIIIDDFDLSHLIGVNARVQIRVN